MPYQGNNIRMHRTVRRKDSASRRQDIINAAFDCIARAGHLSLSTTELAENVGISQPAIFRHFRSKQTLHEAILQEANQRILELIKSYLGQTDRWKDPLLLIQDFLGAMGRHFAEHPGVWLTLAYHRGLLPQGVEPTKQCACWQMRYSLERVCRAAIEAKQISSKSNGEMIAAVLVATLIGIGQQWLNSGRSFDLTERIDFAASSFLQGHALQSDMHCEQPEGADIALTA